MATPETPQDADQNDATQTDQTDDGGQHERHNGEGSGVPGWDPAFTHDNQVTGGTPYDKNIASNPNVLKPRTREDWDKEQQAGSSA